MEVIYAYIYMDGYIYVYMCVVCMAICECSLVT